MHVLNLKTSGRTDMRKVWSWAFGGARERGSKEGRCGSPGRRRRALPGPEVTVGGHGEPRGLTSGGRPWGNPFSASEVERHERFGDSWGTRPSFSLELQGFSFKQVF